MIFSAKIENKFCISYSYCTFTYISTYSVAEWIGVVDLEAMKCRASRCLGSSPGAGSSKEGFSSGDNPTVFPSEPVSIHFLRASTCSIERENQVWPLAVLYRCKINKVTF